MEGGGRSVAAGQIFIQTSEGIETEGCGESKWQAETDTETDLRGKRTPEREEERRES